MPNAGKCVSRTFNDPSALRWAVFENEVLDMVADRPHAFELRKEPSENIQAVRSTIESAERFEEEPAGVRVGARVSEVVRRNVWEVRHDDVRREIIWDFLEEVAFKKHDALQHAMFSCVAARDRKCRYGTVDGNDVDTGAFAGDRDCKHSGTRADVGDQRPSGFGLRPSCASGVVPKPHGP